MAIDCDPRLVDAPILARARGSYREQSVEGWLTVALWRGTTFLIGLTYRLAAVIRQWLQESAWVICLKGPGLFG